VTEPTPFGLNDLKLAVGLTRKVGVPAGIVVNRSDGEDRIIADYAELVGIPILGRIPFRREYAETYSRGAILVEHHEELRLKLLEIYERIRGLSDVVREVVEEDTGEEQIEDAIKFAEVEGGGAFKELTIISGKGGTGKTTVVSSFAMLAENAVLADNDVDAADLHLLIKPLRTEEHVFVGSNKSVIDADKCIGCGRCAQACHFDAIDMSGPANDLVGKTYLIDSLACEACGYCQLVCPVDAVQSHPNHTGKWFVSETEHGVMVHARLGIAEENSGKLVTQVRNKAAELADRLGADMIISDGPPGTGCPVISSVSGTDAVVVVTEPTVSGVHDMERVMELCRHFGVPAYVIINKADLNAEQCSIIETICQRANARVIAEIPFDRVVNDALMAGKTVVEYGESQAAEALRKAWDILVKELK
jgi:MinD superfamily P-loop ATPase